VRPYHAVEMLRLRAAAVAAVLGTAAAGASAPPPGAVRVSARVPAAGVGGSPWAEAAAVPTAVDVQDVAVPVAGSPPGTGVLWFLTIGDSITFGTTRDPRLAGRNISWAARLTSELAARGRRWRLYDTACPGETTLTYATRCPGRVQVPFLAGQSQRTAAMAAIAAHPAGLRLIVVALGSNDLLWSLDTDTRTAVARLVLRLAAILDELRGAAPGVRVVVAGVYDPFAGTAPGSDRVVTGADLQIAELAARLGVGYADFHRAINHAPDGAPLCGLVDCVDLDIHPTVLGQERLARAVLAAVPAA
jgi:lysophospholipase L1-like esterase